jgi:hypothetical protein
MGQNYGTLLTSRGQSFKIGRMEEKFLSLVVCLKGNVKLLKRFMEDLLFKKEPIQKVFLFFLNFCEKIGPFRAVYVMNKKRL